MVNCKLLANQVLLFQAPLASCAQHLDDFSSLLSPEEHARETRYRTASRRQAFIAGRAAIRSTLGAHLRIPPPEVRLTLDPHGKPQHENIGGQRQPSFNISHSPTLVVLGLTKLDGIGIDVEDLGRRVQVGALVRNYFSPNEREEWSSYHSEHQTAAFFRGWTRKEAAWKFFGCEEDMPWRNIEVTLDANPDTRVRATMAADGDCLMLHCFSWNPTSTSIASVVVRTTGCGSPRYKVQTIDFANAEISLETVVY